MMARLALVLTLVFALTSTAVAQTKLTLPTSDGPVSVDVYAAAGDAARPTVLILHGRGGINPAPGYIRFADSLAAAGIDAWLFTYYNDEDQKIMFGSGRDARSARYAARMPAWAKTVDDIADASLAQPKSSGKVGLLGLSNGGFVAVGAAALDPRIGAIVVFYGGIPEPLRGEIKRLPPLLALHGDADNIVPIAEDRALVDLAEALGGEADLSVYPGVGHGFDFDDAYDKEVHAHDHAISFLADHLR